VDWRDLQERVAAILRECGLVAETSRRICTARGAVEFDVYAIDPTTNAHAVYLCECKRWRSRVPQGEVQAFRSAVSDAGSHFGLFISAAGFQAGAFDVAAHTNVSLLDWAGFQELFLERWCRTYWVPTLRARGDPLVHHLNAASGDAPTRQTHGEPIQPIEAVCLFALAMWGPPFNDLAAKHGLPPEPLAPAIWRHRELCRDFLPKRAAEAKSLRELLEALLALADRYIPSPAAGA
jgi:hypothetical protein